MAGHSIHQFPKFEKDPVKPQGFCQSNKPALAGWAIHQRFDIRSTAFLMVVLGDLMQQAADKPTGAAVSPKKILSLFCIPFMFRVLHS